MSAGCVRRFQSLGRSSASAVIQSRILPTHSEARGTRRLSVRQAQSSQIRWLTLASIVSSRSMKNEPSAAGMRLCLLRCPQLKKTRWLRNLSSPSDELAPLGLRSRFKTFSLPSAPNKTTAFLQTSQFYSSVGNVYWV